MQPIKEEKPHQKKKPWVYEEVYADYLYKKACMPHQIDVNKYNPFKLKYLNCLKKTKRIRAYFDEINRIIDLVSDTMLFRRKSKKFRKFMSINLKKVPDQSNQILVDTKNIVRKLKFESENEPSTQIKPKTKYYKTVKKPRFSQLADIESSYYKFLIIN